MSSVLLPQRFKESETLIVRFLHRVYRPVLEFALDRRKLVVGIADGYMKVDGKLIFEAKDLKVGLFMDENAAQLEKAAAPA